MKRILYTLIMILAVSSVKAQKTDFSLGADVVSSYVWRGAYQTSAAVQPAMGMSVAGFSLSAWGSVPFKGEAKEVDFTATYQIAGISLAITDYWWAGEDAFRYFSYAKGKTDHLFEGTVDYQLPIEKFPLSLSVNTMFAGADYKPDGKRAYSTYISASYPFSVKKIIDLEASLGVTPSQGIYADEFALVHIGLKASKEVKITEHFSLPIFSEVIANPKSQDIFFVFGVGLSMTTLKK